jgi:hypothetical protein
LSELCSAAVEDLAEAQLAMGAVATVIADLERLLAPRDAVGVADPDRARCAR